jgi:hypothetical protein
MTTSNGSGDGETKKRDPLEQPREVRLLLLGGRYPEVKKWRAEVQEQPILFRDTWGAEKWDRTLVIEELTQMCAESSQVVSHWAGMALNLLAFEDYQLSLPLRKGPLPGLKRGYGMMSSKGH